MFRRSTLHLIILFYGNESNNETDVIVYEPCYVSLKGFLDVLLTSLFEGCGPSEGYDRGRDLLSMSLHGHNEEPAKRWSIRILGILLTTRRYGCRYRVRAIRLLGRRSHSLSQHTQFLKNNMIAENDFYMKL